MQITEGMIVRSLAGHDANRFYVVLALENGKALIADSKRRKREQPKAKNLRHLAPTAVVKPVSQFGTNEAIRRALWPYNYGGESPVISK